MSRVIQSTDGLTWWQHHIALSRRQEVSTEATATTLDGASTLADNTRMHLYIGLGAAIGILILVGVFCAIVLIKRRRRLDIQELETGHVDSEEDVRLGQGVMAGKPIIFLVPPHGQVPLPAISQRDLIDDPEKGIIHITSDVGPSRPAPKNVSILKRMSALLEGTSSSSYVDAPKPYHSVPLDAELKQNGQLPFPTIEEEGWFEDGTSTRARPMTTPRSRHVRAVSSRTLFKFMPEGAVFASIPRFGKNSQSQGDRPPSLPPLGQLSPFRVPQLRRVLSLKPRSGSQRTRLSFTSGGHVNGPILQPGRRSVFGSAGSHRISKHDRSISLRSDLTSQRSSPSTIKARPRSKESRWSAAKSRATTRSTMSRSNSDVGTFRTGSAASSELPESTWNRFSVHRIETANQISIKRLSGTGPSLFGAVKSVQRLAGPIKRLQPKVVVTANGSPVGRRMSSLAKRLSLVSPGSITPTRRRNPSGQSGYRNLSAEHEVSPITPPRRAFVHKNAQGNVQHVQSAIANAAVDRDQAAAQKAAQISNMIHSNKIGMATTTRQPVAYPAPVVFTQEGTEDPFFLDRTIYSPRSGASPRSGGRRKRGSSGGKPSSASPKSTESTPMRYASSRHMHGIVEEAESDNEGEVSPAVTVTQILTSSLPRETPNSGAWLAASPTLPTAAARAVYNSPVDHHSMTARAASVNSRHSMRSSVSRLSIPEFPSTPSRFHAAADSIMSEADPLPPHAYSDPTTLSSAGENGSSPVPKTSNTNSTVPSSPLDLPSSPPIIARSLPVHPIQSPKAAYKLTKLSKNDEELIPLTATSQPGPLLPRTTMTKPTKSKSSPRRLATTTTTTTDATKPRSRTGPTAKADAEIEAMRRRITRALDTFTVSPSAAAAPSPRDAARAHDSGHEDDDAAAARHAHDEFDDADDDEAIWEAPKLPELDFDPAPLFNSAAAKSPAKGQLQARRMHRTPARR